MRRIENHGRLHSHAPPLLADDDGQREGTSRKRTGCSNFEISTFGEASARKKF
jgi:hypothetical protein